MTSSVLTVAPLRVSFIGGGSDLPSFYNESEGAVVSAAINKYVYVHVKIHDGSFQERFRIAYSDIEHTDSRESIQNDIVRKCLEYLDLDIPLQISTSADLPAGSGLGSSSSFCVALLLALHSFKGESPTKYQLADEASHIEINLLGKSIGKQDQFAASFGGLNLIRFLPNEIVRVEPVISKTNLLLELEGRSRLFWTGLSRKAEEILREQVEKQEVNSSLIKDLVSKAFRFREELESNETDWFYLSQLIEESWEIKRRLAPGIENSTISNLVAKVRNEFGEGVKLLGAGGGGFVFSLSAQAEKESNWKVPVIRPKIDFDGARVLSKI